MTVSQKYWDQLSVVQRRINTVQSQIFRWPILGGIVYLNSDVMATGYCIPESVILPSWGVTSLLDPRRSDVWLERRRNYCYPKIRNFNRWSVGVAEKTTSTGISMTTTMLKNHVWCRRSIVYESIDTYYSEVMPTWFYTPLKGLVHHVECQCCQQELHGNLKKCLHKILYKRSNVTLAQHFKE
jgi:hypothetical protein